MPLQLDGLMRERGGLDFVLNEDAVDISGGRPALGASTSPHPSGSIFLTRPPATSTPRARASSWGHPLALRLCGRDGHYPPPCKRGGSRQHLYMEDGRICGQGDHASLMARGGRYAALFCAQRELEQGYLELIKEAQA